MNKIIEIKNLSVCAITKSILNDINLFIKRGEIFCLVGESGSGKTTLALSIIKLLPKNFKIISGQIIFENQDILKMSESEIRTIRGRKIGMIFQDPGAYLDPLFTIGVHLQEALHNKIVDYKKFIERALEEVELEPDIQNTYPHQLSGGQQQRVMIAMALINKPSLIIADEPTTALDVLTTQQIIKLLNSLAARYNIGMLFITHDIALAMKIGKRIGIMYGGYILEIFNPATQVPIHPYTKILTGQIEEKTETSALTTLNQKEITEMCPFFEKCPERKIECRTKLPFYWKDNETGNRCIKYGRNSAM
ncbi:MAG: ABC transporter ATP-binding protein [Candidatus Omnitrophica bacterium]|nr:ABC transporter ATP-binding protein [Candidatus Omnitrophota bacterium]